MPNHDTQSGVSSGPRSWPVRLLLAVLVASLPAVFGAGLPERAAEFVIGPGFTASFVHSGPFFLVHVLVPLVAVSACVLFLGPGIFLAAALGAGASTEWWVLTAFVLSYATISPLAAVLGPTWSGMGFGLAVVALAVASWGLLLMRVRRDRLPPPPATGRLARTGTLLLAVPFALAALLAPKFLWESFNSDGAHAFESARLLLTQPVPFWPADSGEIGAFPGVNTFLFAYPMSWYLRLFGPNEPGGRLPLLLFLVLAWAAVRGLALARRNGGDDGPRRWLPWVGITAFAWVMSFDATYDPYSADITLPATQDTLAVACFLAFLWASVEARRSWSVVFGLMTAWASPNGLLLLGLWLLAWAVVARPMQRRDFAWTAGIIALAVVSAVAMPVALRALGQPVPGEEHGLVGLLGRFAFLQFTDLRRLLYVILPCGIVPVAYLLVWRRQDSVSRALTLTAVGYFLFFYVQAYISLHQFFPAMVLPLVVMWRTASWTGARAVRRGTLAVVAGGAVALALQTPARMTVDTSGREVGAAVDDRMGGYDRSAPENLRRVEMLYDLFPVTWEPEVPEESYGGSALIWNLYAHRPRPAGVTPNYVLQPIAAEPPPGGRLLRHDEAEGAALYVLSDSVWAAHRALRPPTPGGSRLMSVPRGILFRTETLEDGPPIIEVIDVLARMGVDTDALLDRLGVDR
ncbi:MAG: hypothetical protein WEB90_04580 [Gemmatimonadota bacterium]